MSTDLQHLIDQDTYERDETEFDVRLRERMDAWAAEMRELLATVKTRRRVYREIALRWHELTAIRFRILCYFLEVADTDLDNVFPKRATVAAVVGISVSDYAQHLRGLKHAGWIRLHEFRRSDGTQSSSGIQLGIPFSSGAWWGPATFSRRKEVTRRHRGQRAATVHTDPMKKCTLTP